MDNTSIRNNIPADFLLPSKPAVRGPNQEMGKDQFLQLLIAQLQNQDPTSPQENTEFIAQMAQFSALEAMNNMSDAFLQSQTFSLVGRGIIGRVFDLEGIPSQIIGVVDSAGTESGKPYVMVGEKKVFAENVSQVFDSSIVQGNTANLMAGANLVGKFISAQTAVDGQTAAVNGKVDSMIVEDDKFFLMVKGHKIPLNALTVVAETEEELENATAGETEAIPEAAPVE